MHTSPRPIAAAGPRRSHRPSRIAGAILASLLALGNATAQIPKIVFEPVEVDDAGLGHSVHTVLQGPDDFIWFGGPGGLYRHDGRETRRIVPERASDDADRWGTVTSIALGPDGVLWVAAEHAVWRVHRETESLGQIPMVAPDGSTAAARPASRVVVDGLGRVWAVVGNHLMTFDPELEALVPVAMPDPRVLATTVDDDGVAWIATDKIYRGTRDGAVELHRMDPLPHAESATVRAMRRRGARELWLGTDEGLFVGDLTTGAWKEIRTATPEAGFRKEHSVRAVIWDRHQRLWAGTYESGLFQVDLDHAVSHRYEHLPGREGVLQNDRIHALHQDRSGTIWVGTPDGLCRFDGRTRFHHVEFARGDLANLPKQQPLIRSVLRARSGALWVGTLDGAQWFSPDGSHGVLRADPKDPKLLQDGRVFAIAERPDGEIWIGTMGGGLHRLDAAGQVAQVYRSAEKVLARQWDSITALCFIDRNRLLVGSRAGLAEFDVRRGTTTPLPLPKRAGNRQVGIHVNGIVRGRQGEFWVIQFSAGLLRFDPTTRELKNMVLEFASTGDRMPKFIFSVCDTGRGVLVLGVSKYGVLSYDLRRGKLELPPDSTKIPRSVVGLLPDGNGGYWGATKKQGLVQYDAELRIVGKHDRIELGEDRFVLGSYHRAESGELLFGGHNGIVSFLPEQIAKRNPGPPVVLTDCRVFGDPALLDAPVWTLDEIVLSREQNFFEFQFAALDFVAPERNQYTYRLEGFEEQWNEVGNRNRARYTNVSPGDYTFLVKAANADGTWSTTNRAVRLTITPAWWESWWLRGIAVVLILLSGISFFRRTQMIRSQSRQLQREAVERLRIEAALRESEARLHTAFDHAPFEFWVTNTTGRWLLQNPASLRNWGDLRGNQPSDANLPPLLSQWHARWQIAVAGEVSRGEDELDMGGERRYLYSLAAPIFANGEVTGVVGVHVDVTDLKRAQEDARRLELQLQQAQKMEAIGRLAGGIAHDFNNILTAILGQSELARAMIAAGEGREETRAELEEIERCAQRGAALTRQLLAFGRRSVTAPVPVDLNELVSDIEPMLRRLLRESIRLELRLATELRAVHVDRSQIEQVVLNLAVNASDAMRDGGVLRIATRNTIAHTQDTTRHVVELAIEDTGCGIAPEDLPRIFEPFFTTKAIAHGTGLGLAVVHGIVQQSGGSITVDSEHGTGSTFTVRFPATDAATPQPKPRAPQGGAQGNGETILVCEDEDAIRPLICSLLERNGYRVLAAATPGQALELVRDDQNDIDLLISDVIMPEMSGPTLARRLLTEQAGTAVLYVSGYTANELSDQGMLDEGVELLMKPFPFQVLLEHVRRALDRRSSSFPATDQPTDQPQ